ncbi:hypothetical protein ACHAXT_001514 [Thalassiosira profunda]
MAEEAPACPSTEGMLELDSLQIDAHKNVPPSPAAEDGSDSDSACSEGISSSYHPSMPPTSSRHTTYLLGHAFDSNTDRAAIRKFQRSLYWMTYRNDLAVPLRPYAGTAQGLVGNLTHGGGLSGVTGEGGMKSDAGWGCMLRSAQMLLAQAVRRHYSPPGDAGGNGDNLQWSGSIRHAPGNRQSNIEHHKQNWRQLSDPHEAERIAAWFADFPNHPDLRRELDDAIDEFGKGGLDRHWYSLHQMVAAGLGLGVLPGEWYGPQIACHVLRELNEMHCERREKVAERIKKEREETDGDRLVGCDMFRVHVATEGCIYLDAISKLMNRNGCNSSGPTKDASEKLGTKSEAIDDPLSPPNDPLLDDPLRSTQPQNDTTPEERVEHWVSSLLLLLPLRLGIQSISAKDYGSTLAKMMSFPQSVGMLGGTPRHALWFYGADAVEPPPSDGGDKEENGEEGGGEEENARGWYGLDPHIVQTAPRGTRVPLQTETPNAIVGSESNDAANSDAAPIYRWKVQLTDSYLRSLHISSTTSHPNHDKTIPLSGLDPSCALGFYIRDHADFVHFRHLLKELADEHCRSNKLPEVVTVAERTPNYEVDVSSAIKGMLGKGVGAAVGEVDIDGFSLHSDDEEGTHHEEEDDDDEDFVLI